MSTKNFSIIRYIYLYLVSAITIVLLLISSIGMINLVLKEYVFDVKGWEEIYGEYYECGEDSSLREDYPKTMPEPRVVLSEEDKEECIERVKERRSLERKNDVKRDFVNYLAMLIVALPLYIYHWGLINKKTKE
jgi:hypothetical protein